MTKAVHIMVGGPEAEIPDLAKFNQAGTTWIGVDSGSKRLLDAGIIPDVALGDFDSLTEAELVEVKEKVLDVREFPAEKDETDTELGLSWAMTLKPTVIRIFGATGGRIDHLLANLMMLTKPEFQAAVPFVELIDKYNYMRMYLPGEYSVMKHHDKKYVAFTTMADVTGLTLIGFKYPLLNASYPVGSALSSNEFLGESGVFSFKSGLVLYIESSD